MQRNFLPDCKRKYFIFSDSPLSYFTDSVHVEDKSSIVYTYIENKPWPYITLLRYHLFVDYYHLWKDCDYTFFINGNYCFYQHVGRDILPTPEESGLVVAEHQKSLDLHPRDYPYERNPRSTAYIPVGEGTHYYAGGLNGGITEEFYKLSLEIRDTTQKDLDNEIIAVWHDESQLNARLLHRTVKILSPWYVWPSYSKKRSIRKQIIAGTLDKNNYGGYDWLRGATDKKRKPKWRRRLERYLIIAVSVIAIIAAAYFIWQQC